MMGSHTPWLAFLLGLFCVSSVCSQAPLRSVTLCGKVRDQKEYSVTDINNFFTVGPRLPNGHPDFEQYYGDGCKGAVENRISTSDMPSIFPYDNRGPRLIGYGCGNMYTGPTYFPSWFNDTTTNDTISNRPFLVPLRFDINSDCRMVFRDSIFFPLDSGKEIYSLSDPAQPTFGQLQPSRPTHNFGFTLEFHSTFTYSKGTHQVFSFTGDDDVWVFVNDSLVIDLSGIHDAHSDSVDLDKLPSGLLVDGGQYVLDFFSAERHTVESNIRITTSIILGDEGSVFDTTIDCQGRPMALSRQDFPPKWYTDWATPPLHGMVGYLLNYQFIPLAGAEVVLSNGGGTVTTDSFGNFSVVLPRHWSGTVTPVASAGAFNPPSVTIADITAPRNLNFYKDTLSPVVQSSSWSGPGRFGISQQASGSGGELLIAIERPCAYALTIYDVAGNVRWRHSAARATPGYDRVSLRDVLASAAGNGVYFAELSRAEGRTALRVRVIR